MSFVAVYLRLYADCLVKALGGIGRNAWTLALPVGLAMAYSFVAPLVLSIPGAGGIIFSLLNAAVFSCYLYFTGEVVAHSKVSLADFKKSIGAYFWSAISFFFVLWIVNLVLSMLLAGSRQASTIQLAVDALSVVLLSAVPEVIYQRGTRFGLETITRAVRFLQENWIEWLFPQVVIVGGVGYGAFQLLVLLGGLALLPLLAVLGALFHVFFVFRGHLFEVLSGSTHRQRMFRYRGTKS